MVRRYFDSVSAKVGIEKGYVGLPAGQVHYRHAPGAGAPLLLFHRTPVWSSSFDQLIAALAGWRPVYAFDTPGFGESFVPSPGTSSADYGDWFIGAIDALGITDFHLYGHHSGSHFAIEIAARGHGRARSLTIDGAMYLTPEERAERRTARGPTPAVDEQGDYIRAGWAFLRPFYPRFVPDLVHQEFVGAMRSLPTRETCLRALMDQDFPAVLAQASCPILACAAADDVYADLLPRIARDHPRARIATYGSAGIAGPELRPDEIAELLRDFIDSSERT